MENQLSGAMARETNRFSSLASTEPQIVTKETDSNQLTIPYGLGNQRPVVLPSLNNLNLLPHPFNVLNTMVVLQPDEQNSSQSPEPNDASPTSTPSMNLRIIEVWETPHTTTDDATFHSEDERRRVFWAISSTDTFHSDEPRPKSITSSPSSTRPPPRQQKRKLIIEISFSQKVGRCHSTCARHATSPYLHERHPNAQHKLKQDILQIKL